MIKKKIFMAGAGGMLGEAFYETFKNEYEVFCTDKDVNSDWLNYLDFNDLDKYRDAVLKFNPDYLFHLGAITDLEFSERNADLTFKTNTISVEQACRISNELDIPILYISTAGIFDGSIPLYNDYETPNPMGIYAKTKFYGEKHVLKNSNKSIVCRAGWMMGGGPKKDKKFINKICKQIEKGQNELYIVNDKMGTPTYTYDFARNTKLILENNKYGLYNLVCGGLTSRLEVVKELVSILNRNNSIEIKEVDSNYFIDEYFAPRPPNERLVNYKLDLMNLNIMRDWKICLKEYIEKDFTHLKL